MAASCFSVLLSRGSDARLDICFSKRKSIFSILYNQRKLLIMLIYMNNSIFFKVTKFRFRLGKLIILTFRNR